MRWALISVAAAVRPVRLGDTDIAAEFLQFDTGAKGYLDASDLQQMVHKFGLDDAAHPVDAPEVMELAQLFGGSGGRVDLKAFADKLRAAAGAPGSLLAVDPPKARKPQANATAPEESDEDVPTPPAPSKELEEAKADQDSNATMHRMEGAAGEFDRVKNRLRSIAGEKAQPAAKPKQQEELREQQETEKTAVVHRMAVTKTKSSSAGVSASLVLLCSVFSRFMV
mmetsp:Transcript_88567/g.236717  ORF Transcript_88567/g.236717 Transcript_88567/m.236717 type:complete len:225 (-) Transcript_88567:60-734(-)